MTGGLALGAPGVYRAPARVERAYRGVRLDIAGIVGLAPRGPIGTAVRVDSWSEYELVFGGFEGRGRLPYAVAAYFDQGGERVYVVRVGPMNEAPGATEAVPATAIYRLALPGPERTEPLRIAAANEGVWGNRLRVELTFDVALQFQLKRDGMDGAGSDPDTDGTLPVPDGVYLQVGSLLLVRTRGSAPEFYWVEGVVDRDVGASRLRVAVLDRKFVTSARSGQGRTTVAVIEGRLAVDDRDRRFARSEQHSGLGLRPDHPRWLLHVLRDNSTLLAPVDASAPRIEPATALLPSIIGELDQRGRDRDENVTIDDLFDLAWDPKADEQNCFGVHALLSIDEIGLVLVPDLAIDPIPVQVTLEPDPHPRTDACFHPCPPRCSNRGGPHRGGDDSLDERPRLEPLHELVNARTRDGLDEWASRQLRLVELAERVQTFVVLLDVPPGLDVRGISEWRAFFDSSYAAAYHPWVGVSRDEDQREGAVFVPPSSFAAGIIAERERRLGLPWGPANDIASGAVALRDRVSSDEHAGLHAIGVNVFLATRDGMQLTAARTLSRQTAYRQLTVRRLMSMIRLTISRDSQWMAFEPNNELLWSTVRFHLTNFLRALFVGGAFAGASEDESFFVRCDAQLNPQPSLDLGRLVVEVGVSPAEPLEFIVLRIERSIDGIRVEERRA